jgi:hypothetical protein
MTVGKLKLSSLTIKQVYREAEGSLLAVQVLVAQPAGARWGRECMAHAASCKTSPTN